MKKQKFFNFNLNENKDLNNFYVNETNIDAFKIINESNFLNKIFLYGPNKSGKTHLANIWANKNKAIKYCNNLDEIISNKKNILIDDLFFNLNEENIFHIINHCKNLNLKILLTSQIDIYEFNFKLLDLKSRLKTFHYVKINNPNDEMSLIILTKLLTEKQFIIKNKEIFEFLIKRVNRSYEEIYNLANKMDNLSLEKKRQLTIPLIKEIL